jgi:hypothetical protein
LSTFTHYGNGQTLHATTSGSVPGLINKFMSKEPVYRLFEPFGQCWFRNHTSISELDNRYKAGQLLGYTDWQIWDLKNQNTQISRNIVFSKAIPNPTTPATIDLTDDAKSWKTGWSI